MDFKTVATKENTIITAAKDDAADLTENDDAVESSNTKTKRPFMKSYILYMEPRGSRYSRKFFMWYRISLHGVMNILGNFAWGNEYPRKFCMGYRIS